MDIDKEDIKEFQEKLHSINQRLSYLEGQHQEFRHMAWAIILWLKEQIIKLIEGEK